MSDASFDTFNYTVGHLRPAVLLQQQLDSTSASSAFAAYFVTVEPHFVKPYAVIALNTAGPASAASAVRSAY